jgi:serine/threonine protein kinase
VEADRPRPRGEETIENTQVPATEPADSTTLETPNPETTEPWGVGPGKSSGSDANWDATTVFDENQANPQLGPESWRLGDYLVLEEIGQGSMGVVYRAWQLSLKRDVALKLIRTEGMPSAAELRRFQHEVEAVASFDHPGIVTIYEIGNNQGRHFFSMKLIKGENLQQASQRLRGQYKTIGQILAKVAQAVQHAHDRGILHRDLKPSNILVDAEDNPHVTDFGLAKRIDLTNLDPSQTTAIVGTPAYMAPEQATAARGAITTATDIYGLGGVLYALLSGHSPHRGSSVLEILDAVREKTPVPPSKFDPSIPRDLEVICMKCLDKEPKKRYHSAEALADDLNLWLEGRPINARSVGWAAQVVMWCRRKPLLASLTAALLIFAIAGAIGIVFHSEQLRHQRDELARANLRVELEAKTTQAINDFLTSDLLAWSSPFVATRRDMPISDLLDRAASLASTRFAGEPKIEGAIHQTIGTSYLALGKLEKAEVELLQSQKIRQTLPEEDELDRLSTEYALACLRRAQGRYEAAKAHAFKAYNGRRLRLGEKNEATLEAATLLGALLKLTGHVEDSKAFLEQTAETAHETLGDDHPLTLRVLTSLAVIAHDQGQFDDAVRLLGHVTFTSIKHQGADHPESLLARSILGASLHGVGHYEKAEEILEAVLEPARNVLGLDHQVTLQIQGNLAAVRCKLGRYGEAARQLQETLEKLRQEPGDHLELFKTENNLAVNLLEQGKPAEAEPLLRDLVQRMRTHLKEDNRELGDAISLHAAALRELNKTAEAETLNTQAIAIFRKTLPPEHPRIIKAEAVQAALLLANGKFAEAEKLARELVKIRSKPGAIESPYQLGSVKSVLGGALTAHRRFDEAKPLVLEGYESVKSDPKAPAIRVRESLERVIQFYESQGNLEEAARWRAKRVAQPGP